MTDKVPSYSITVSIAGDLQTARQSLRRQCVEEGLCVTLTPTTFIYTHGAEDGMRIGFVNYPRFPKTAAAILERANHVARCLMKDLCQRTALIETPEETYWIHQQDSGGQR